MSQEKLSVLCSRAGYELPRSTLAKIESGIRAISDVEVFVIANALKVRIPELFPPGLAKTIRDGKITPFHVRTTKD